MGDRDKRLRQRVRAALAELSEAAQEHADDTMEHVSEAARDGLDEANKYLRRQWRERPVAVAATAFGLGMLLGMALSGGRR